LKVFSHQLNKQRQWKNFREFRNNATDLLPLTRNLKERKKKKTFLELFNPT